jgi:hypothetical protein
MRRLRLWANGSWVGNLKRQLSGIWKLSENWKPPGKWNLGTPKLPDQVVRIAIIFAIGLTALVIARQKFVPESFGEIGHYRADAVDLVASQEVHYAGWQSCAMCHVEETEKKLASYHRSLSCEICHGPAQGHAEDPVEVNPIIDRKREMCLSCHGYLASRPTGFPQILELQHNPMQACVKCHNPHDPTPPHVPGACSACHAHIARTKAISHHHALDCETCHSTPPEHRESPRLYFPNKPRTREFCGQCHGVGAEDISERLGIDLSKYHIPQVDLEAHGNTYLCWQCHYPHFPEGR